MIRPARRAAAPAGLPAAALHRLRRAGRFLLYLIPCLFLAVVLAWKESEIE